MPAFAGMTIWSFRVRGGPHLSPDNETSSAAIAPPPASARALLGNPNFRLLWYAGGVGNSMRWLEMLGAGILTFELTG